MPKVNEKLIEDIEYELQGLESYLSYFLSFKTIPDFEEIYIIEQALKQNP